MLAYAAMATLWARSGVRVQLANVPESIAHTDIHRFTSRISAFLEPKVLAVTLKDKLILLPFASRVNQHTHARRQILRGARRRDLCNCAYHSRLYWSTPRLVLM